MSDILLGTSGWDYPEWSGRVYPRRGASDKLRYYAGLFPIVEVNSTFYRLPPPSVTASWVKRTPAGFRFAAKFPQTITHDLRLVRTDEELARFLAVLKPIREGGKFAAALLQLPPSLPFEPTTVRHFYETLPGTCRSRSSSASAPGSHRNRSTSCGSSLSPTSPWTVRTYRSRSR